MGKWSIHKTAVIAIFILLVFAFFAWMASQIGDLGFFFGFRTSYTTANDVAGIISSMNSVYAASSYQYTFGAERSSGLELPVYDVSVRDGLVCVTSKTDLSANGEYGRVLSDCATFNGGVIWENDLNDVRGGNILFERFDDSGEYKTRMTFSSFGG